MEPDTSNRLTRFIADLVNRIACRFGDHSYTWKLKKGETIKLNGPPPARATCRYCGITHQEASK